MRKWLFITLAVVRLSMSLLRNQSSIAGKGYPTNRQAKIQRVLARELKRPDDYNPFVDAHMKALADAINGILTQHFKGYTWRLGLSRNPPLISLRCEHIPTREVININPRDVQTYDDLKRVLIGQCGQFLERVNASRSGVIGSQVEQLTQGYTRFVIPDRSQVPVNNMDKRYVMRSQSCPA